MSNTGFVEIHSHFLYGMDDGAQTAQDMFDMLDAANQQGISVLYATPHVTLGIRPFDQTLLVERVQEARAYCRFRQYDIRIESGAELLYTPAMLPYISDQKLPTLGNTDMALMEFSPDIPYTELEAAVKAMEDVGYTPILAHVERYRCLLKGKRLDKLWQDHDVFFQVNAHTLLSHQRLCTGRKIHHWLKKGMIDYIASDAHDTQSRPFRIQKAYQYVLDKYPNMARKMLASE